MKKTCLFAFCVTLLFAKLSYPQNTFPTPTGNVGIGATSTPDTKLVIQASASDNQVSFWDQSGTKKAYIGTTISAGQMIPGSALSDMVIRSENQKIMFSADAGTHNHMTIAMNGNVGIGTASPQVALDVNGTIYSGQSAWNRGYANLTLLSNSSLNFYRPSGADNLDYGGQISGVQVGGWGGISIQPQNTQFGHVALTDTYSSGLDITYPTIYFSTNGSESMRISSENVGMGTTDNSNWDLASSAYGLAVSGGIIATKVTVKLQSAWPDYDFKPTYHLTPLSEVKTYINQNRHLPDMPSEKEVAEKGLDLGEMNKLLTRKVEESTLYLIEMDKQLKEQALINEDQKKLNLSEKTRSNY